jgi:hypothetical protein
VAERTQVPLGYRFKFGGQDYGAQQIGGHPWHVF